MEIPLQTYTRNRVLEDPDLNDIHREFMKLRMSPFFFILLQILVTSFGPVSGPLE